MYTITLSNKTGSFEDNSHSTFAEEIEAGRNVKLILLAEDDYNESNDFLPPIPLLYAVTDLPTTVLNCDER